MENKTMEPITPILIGAQQAAKSLGICTKTLWTLTKAGSIPCVRIGCRVLYDPLDLKRWIESQKTAAIHA
jgi:predicted DNA-binding transcriptional regulator AlpA